MEIHWNITEQQSCLGKGIRLLEFNCILYARIKQKASYIHKRYILGFLEFHYIMNCNELMDIIKGGERRNVELKRSMPWVESDTQAKLTKSILSISNIRDGGIIIIGAKRNDDNTYEPEGVYPEHLDAYDSDHVADVVDNYADPYVKFTLERIVCNENTFIIIRVEDIDEVPVICKRDWIELRCGAIYVRSRRKPESVEVRDEAEMREIIEMAVDKSIRRFYQRLAYVGITQPAQIQVTDDELYDKELGDLI